MIAVEKNVPVPTRGGSAQTIYPFTTMEVGDSFVRPADRAAAVRMAAFKYARANKGWAYASTVREENQTMVVRLWRTS